MKEFFKKIPPFAYFMALTAILFLIDIITKWVVQNNCTPGVPITVIPNFWYINLSYNTGIAFGLKIDNVFGRILNITISLVMSGAIFAYWFIKHKKFTPFMNVIATLMLAGAVGNLIDRAFYWSLTTGFDGVIDFMQFYLGGGPSKSINFMNPFATFNLADAYLVVGVILMIIYMIIDAYKHRDRSYETGEGIVTKPEIEKKEESDDTDHQ